MNGRSPLAHDDSAHGPSSEPLLHHSYNPKDEDAGAKRLSLRSLSSIRDYFAQKAPTPGYMLFLALVFGVSSGIVAFVYDTYFEAILKLVWEVSSAYCLHRSRLHVKSTLSLGASPCKSTKEQG